MKKARWIILLLSMSLLLQAETPPPKMSTMLQEDACHQQNFELIKNMQLSPEQENKFLRKMIENCLQNKTELENENNNRSFAMTSISMVCILMLQLVSLSELTPCN